MEDSTLNRVSLAGCERYHPETVKKAMCDLLEPFGGIKGIVSPGQKVLLKPNLLAAAPPAEAVTTHPLIVKVVTGMIHDAGGKVFIGDSPGSDDQKTALRVSGLLDVIEETGSNMLLFKTVKHKMVEGFRKRSFPLAAELDQVDLVINMGKLKTHSLTGLTGAVKNIYGCLIGGSKKKYHMDYPLPLDFSRLLIDVYLAVRPAFSILDAVVAMEGAGPRRGKPRRLGLLMASPNAVALDSIAAEITGFVPEQVTTIAAARMLRLPGSDRSGIEIKGLTLEQCRVPDFDRGPASSGSVSRLIARFPIAYFRNILYARRPYPRVNEELCSGCGICYEKCPAQVIDFSRSIPDIDHYECIRCYCCQELCPQGAIDLNKS